MREQTNNAHIRLGIRDIETMTRFALAVLALASGVYTYLGVRSLLDGSATQVFLAAVIYSAAVSVGIYAFWSYMMRFFPLIRESGRRMALIAVMACGSAMIVAMSSWLNAAALAGSAALEQHLAVTLESYSGDLDDAHARALSSQSLLPDVKRASDRFARLAEEERREGALTGTSGSGSVVQLLGQMSAELDELGETIVQSREKTAELFETGQQHLARMRGLVSAPGHVAPRADSFAEEAVALAGVIASLQETSVAPSVRRAAEDLSLGFIAPIADGNSEDLAQRQTIVMANVRDAVDAQSAALAQAAEQILAEPEVESSRFIPLSSAEAVIRYASDFLPSWAGAISIDLLPAALVFILAIAYGHISREDEVHDAAENMTAAEMMRAVQIFRSMEGMDARPDGRFEDEDADTQEPGREAQGSGGADIHSVVRPVDAAQMQRIKDRAK